MGMEEFEKQAAEKRSGFVRELLSFLGQNKKWWLIPILTVLLIFGALMIFASGSAAAPFIYTLF
jgi:hypothetical protein